MTIRHLRLLSLPPLRGGWKSIGTWERSSQKIFWVEKFAESFTEIFWSVQKSTKSNAMI